MAFGMKQWIGVVVAGIALVAVWRLPPEAPDSSPGQVRSAEGIRHRQLDTEMRVTGDILRRILWADSLSALTAQEAEDGLAVLVPEPDTRAVEALSEEGAAAAGRVRREGDAVTEQRARLAERIRGQIDDRVGDRQRMVFSYVVQPHDHRQLYGSYSSRNRTETYVGTRAGVDYCMQVRVAPSDFVSRALALRLAGNDRGTRPRSDELGPCRFYLTYGFAGTHVQEWLERGAIHLALEAGADPLEIAIPVDRMARRWYSSIYRGDGDVGLSRCLGGLVEPCAELFEDAGRMYVTEAQYEVVRRSPATSISSDSNFGRRIDDGEYLLADLEAEFGREAFEEFWTAEAEVGPAFEAAFGVDAGTWLVGWLDASAGVDPPGPKLPGSATSGTMLTLAGLLGIAYWRRRERRVVG